MSLDLLAITSCGRDRFGPTIPELVIARHMRQRGHRIPFVVQQEGRFARTLREAGTPVLVRSYAGDARKVWDRAAMALGSKALARRFAASRCVVAFRLSSTPLALAIARRLGVPAVAYLHGYTERGKYLRYQVHRADLVISVSQAVRDIYVSATEGARPPEQPQVLLHNGIDAEGFRAQARGSDLRGELGIPPDVDLVGMSGAYALKGADVFLEAAAEVGARRPGTHFLVAGDFLDGAFRERLLGFARDAGLEPRMHWVGFRRDMAAVMAACDLWALPSRADSFPLAGLEALAMGKPLVASAVGGVPEMVEEGRTGFLCPPEDPRALADRLSTLLEDAALRATMGARAARSVVERFSLNQQVETFERCILNLIRSPQPPQPVTA